MIKKYSSKGKQLKTDRKSKISDDIFENFPENQKDIEVFKNPEVAASTFNELIGKVVEKVGPLVDADLKRDMEMIDSGRYPEALNRYITKKTMSASRFRSDYKPSQREIDGWVSYYLDKDRRMRNKVTYINR